MKLSILLWLALSAGVVWAQDPNVQRFEQMLVAAEEGDPSAQYALGQIYELGLGTQKSSRTAFTWYEKSAKKGYARAQLSLGQAHYWGRYGQPKNLALAAEWFKRAAAQGNSQAKTQLATMYALGQGVAQDAQQAQTLRSEVARSTVEETEADIQALSPTPQPDPAVQQAEATRLKQEDAARKVEAQQAAKAKEQELAQQQTEAKQKLEEKEQTEQTLKLAKVKTAVLDTRWLGADKKPTLHLPSEAVTCVDNASGLVCTSEAQDTQRGNTKFRYSVKSFLRNFTAEGGFSMSYRNKVTEILQDSPDTPIQLGWQSQTHELTCTKKAKQIICLKSGSEQIYTAAP